MSQEVSFVAVGLHHPHATKASDSPPAVALGGFLILSTWSEVTKGNHPSGTARSSLLGEFGAAFVEEGVDAFDSFWVEGLIRDRR